MLDKPAKKFFLCPPTYYEIEYLINDWMEPGSKINKAKAQQQWQSLYDAYHQLGVDVSIIDPVSGIPEQTFAGDSIFLFDDRALSGRFRHPQRLPELEPMAAWFKNLGYQVHDLPDGVHFEGNAEAIMWNGKIVGGFGIRSDREAYQSVSEIFDVEVIPVHLRSPYYHLDTGFCPLNDETIAYVPEAFEESSREVVARLAPNVIEVNREEAQLMASNSKAVGDTVVVSNPGVPKFIANLKALGFKTIVLDMSEFLKAGAGAKCLTLEAYYPV